MTALGVSTTSATAPRRGRNALIVLPTYQECENIEEVLRRLRACAPDVEVLVVDDGSPDGTADLAEQFGSRFGGVTVMRRSVKDGLGNAYRAGFAAALEQGYEFVFEMDADLSHPPEAVPRMLAATEDADLVIGSRYVAGGSTPGWPRRRRALSRGGNKYAAMMLGMPVGDATSGFRVYRASTLRAINVGDTTSTGYSFQIELASLVYRAGLRIVECPITFKERINGYSKISAAIVREALAKVTWWGIRYRVRRAFTR